MKTRIFDTSLHRQHDLHLTYQTWRQARPTLFDKAQVTFVAFYVAIAGIYWLPGISYILISYLKIAIFGALATFGLIRFRIYSKEQQVVYFLLAVCAVGAFISNALTTDTNAAVDQARNYIEPLLWLIALYGIRPRAYPLLISRLKLSLSLFFLLALYPVGVFVGLLPNFNAPGALVDPTGINLDNEWVVLSANILGGGFNSKRTGWGATVAPMALFLSTLYLFNPRSGVKKYYVAGIILAGSLASIIVTGARGGTLALLIAAGYGFVRTRFVLASNLAVIAVVTLLMFSLDFAAFLPEKFLRNLDATGSLYEVLNTMSTGRLDSYVGGLEHFFQSPFVGKGPYEARIWIFYGRQQVYPHNLWIKEMAISGLLVFAPLLFLTKRIISLVLRSPQRNGTNNRPPKTAQAWWPDMSLAIAAGLLMAMVEPSALIGSFNSAAIIWLAIWFVMVRHRALSFHR